MTYKQEPCPLCGRDMTAIETYPGRGELYCGHCDLTIGGNDAKTPEELIALMDSSEHRRLQAENAKLRELLGKVIATHDKMCTQRGNCFGCVYFDGELKTPFSQLCVPLANSKEARELGIDLEEIDG